MSTLNVGAIDYTTGVAIKSQAVNTQTGTTYTFVASDAGKLVSASNASPVTFTIPPQSSVTWGSNAVLKVVNYGAGVLTVNGGSGVTVTNTAATVAQFSSAVAIRTGSDAWTLVPFSGGVSNADFSNGATGTYTDSGVNYKYVTFTSSGTLTITKSGFADVVLIGGGSAYDNTVGYGVSNGKVLYGSFFLSVGTLTVTIGAGGLGRLDGWVAAANTAQQGPATSLGTLTTFTTGIALAGSYESVTSSITGSSVTYPNATYGNSATVSSSSLPGVAIIRVRT